MSILVRCVLLAACLCTTTAAQTLPPLAPPLAASSRSASGVVEVALTADEGTVRLRDGGADTEMWLYNGSFPGPTIEAEVGETLVVTFTNNLAVPTSIEWLGLETPAGMDGSEIAHPAVPPGGTYRYEIPLLRAALYQYAAGVDPAEQVERGLYGMLLVRDPADTLPGTEHLIALDDILLDAAGQIAPPATDPLARAERAVNGREGNLLLANGRAGREVPVTRGEPQRLRVLNASNSRYMLISSIRHPFWLIGTGGGLLETPVRVFPIPQGQDHIDFYFDQGYLLSPGERADLYMTPSGTAPIPLTWTSYDRGLHEASTGTGGNVELTYHHNLSHREPGVLLTLVPTGGQDAGEYVPPSTLRDIAEIDTVGARRIPVLLDHSAPAADGSVAFTVQIGKAPPAPFVDLGTDAAPNLSPGETVVWEIHNLTRTELSFHTQGFPFQPIEVEVRDENLPSPGFYRITRRYLEERDTARLPKRTGDYGRSRTISRFAQRIDDAGRASQIAAFGKTPTASQSGGWLFGSRILEHAALGSQGFVEVGVPIANETPGADALQFGPSRPNPTAGRATIPFELAAPGHVTLRVFDVLGKSVATLLDKPMSAGAHVATWDAAGLASGVYVVRLETEGGVETQRVTVVR